MLSAGCPSFSCLFSLIFTFHPRCAHPCHSEGSGQPSRSVKSARLEMCCPSSSGFPLPLLGQANLCTLFSPLNYHPKSLGIVSCLQSLYPRAYHNDWHRAGAHYMFVPQAWTLWCYYYYYYFFAVLGLRLCARAFSSCGERGPLFIAVRGPLLSRSTSSRHAGSVAVTHGPSCSAACGILPDQGSNPCPLHRQTDSQPLCHQGSPLMLLFFNENRRGEKQRKITYKGKSIWKRIYVYV